MPTWKSGRIPSDLLFSLCSPKCNQYFLLISKAATDHQLYPYYPMPTPIGQSYRTPLLIPHRSLFCPSSHLKQVHPAQPQAMSTRKTVQFTSVLLSLLPQVQTISLIPSIAINLPIFPDHIYHGSHRTSALNSLIHHCISACNTSRYSLWTHQWSRPVKKATPNHILSKNQERK